MSIIELEDQIQALVTYMRLKIRQRDWHGVADSAMDIRELEAKKEILAQLEGNVTRTTVEVAKLVLDNEALKSQNENLIDELSKIKKSLVFICELDILKADNQWKMASVAENALRGQYDEL